MRCGRINGQVWEAQALADDISSGGMYIQLPQNLCGGARVFTVTQLPGGARLAAWGEVLRKEDKEHGLIGMAIRFYRIRLLPESQADSGFRNGSSLH